MIDQRAVMVGQICAAIAPLLRGFPPEVQGAVLADLTAMWLAGHMGQDAEHYREELLNQHIARIRELVPECEHDILARCPPSGHG